MYDQDAVLWEKLAQTSNREDANGHLDSVAFRLGTFKDFRLARLQGLMHDGLNPKCEHASELCSYVAKEWHVRKKKQLRRLPGTSSTGACDGTPEMLLW